MKTILVTGATGIFGRYLAWELLKHKDVKSVFLVRGNSQKEAHDRAQKTFKRKDKFHIVHGDLSKERFGLSGSDYDDLASTVTHILHSAGSIHFILPLEEIRRHNVTTTERMLRFAKDCKKLERFGYMSTAFVSGKRSGVIMEDEFEHNEGFSNTYQQSKYEAESLVRSQKNVLPIVIFRPPLVITPSVPEDYKGPVNFFPVLISYIVRNLVPFVPGSPESRIDIVNAFDVAKIIINLLLKDNLSHTTYHISHGKGAFTVQTFYEMIEQKLGKKIDMEYCGDMNSCMKLVKEKLHDRPDVQKTYARAASFLSEPSYGKVFDNRNTLSELGITHLGEDPRDTLRLVLDEHVWNFST